jgi:hypothetical protein
MNTTATISCAIPLERGQRRDAVASDMPDAALPQGEDQSGPYRILRTPGTVIERGHEKKITSFFGLSWLVECHSGEEA